MKEFEKYLIKIQKELLNKVPDLNWGGCIQFAYYFSNTLNLLNIPHKVLLCNKPCDGIPGRSYCKFRAVSHVILYVEGIGYFDGHKIMSKEYLRETYSFIRTTKLDLNLLRTNYEWNDWYNISDNKIIINTIKKYLDDYTR